MADDYYGQMSGQYIDIRAEQEAKAAENVKALEEQQQKAIIAEQQLKAQKAEAEQASAQRQTQTALRASAGLAGTQQRAAQVGEIQQYQTQVSQALKQVAAQKAEIETAKAEQIKSQEYWKAAKPVFARYSNYNASPVFMGFAASEGEAEGLLSQYEGPDTPRQQLTSTVAGGKQAGEYLLPAAPSFAPGTQVQYQGRTYEAGQVPVPGVITEKYIFRAGGGGIQYPMESVITQGSAYSVSYPPAQFFPRVEYEINKAITRFGQIEGKGGKVAGEIKQQEISQRIASGEYKSQAELNKLKEQYARLSGAEQVVGRTAAVGLDIGTWVYRPTAYARTGIFIGSLSQRAYSTLKGKSVTEYPSIAFEYIKAKPLEAAAATLVTAGAVYGTMNLGTYMFGKKPTKVIPTVEEQNIVEPFSRQRATVMIKTEGGKYVLGKTKTGDIISFGGKIEEGETARQAAIREFGEEAFGLKFNKGHIITKAEEEKILKNVVDFKFAKKVVTPEETFITFTATIPKGTKMKAASDIIKFVEISPKNIFIKGATGQTAVQPISRISMFPFGRVRAYEAGIINLLETGRPVSWLKIGTREGEYYLGTQSRYDVPYQIQKQYLQAGKKQEELLLAHGTSQPNLARIWWPFKKKAVVSGELSQRGAAPGLYLQPPISAAKKQPGYIGLSYLGFKAPTSEFAETKVGFFRPGAYTFMEVPKSPIVPTPKTYSGMESELLIVPETTIQTKGKAEIFSIGLKRTLIQPVEIVKGGKKAKISTISIGDEGAIKYVSPSSQIMPFTPISKPSKSSEVSVISVPSKASKVSIISKASTISKPSIVSRVSIPSISSIPSKAYTPSVPSVPSVSEILSIPSVPSKPSISKVPSKPSAPSKPIIPSKSYIYPTEKGAKVIGREEGLKGVGGAFKLFIKRLGKYKEVPGIFAKGEAIRKGESIALTTLARSFKIMPTRGYIKTKGIEQYQPGLKFRTYKIRGGKKIPLKEEWIQRAKYSLGTMGERKEIQAARKKKKWF